MICTKDENNVHIQGTCSLSAYHVSLINSSPPKKITNNPHQQPTYMYGPIRNIFYIRQADELQSMYAIAGRAKRITNTRHQHQHTSHKYFPDKQMNFNLCIPLPGKQPRETSGNLLSVQFTPLVSRAMVKFHTRKHLIVSTILDRSIIWLTRGESVKRENNKSRSSNAKRWAGYKRIYKIDTNIFSNE